MSGSGQRNDDQGARRSLRERLSGPWGFLVGIAGLVGTGLAIYTLATAADPLTATELRLEDRRPPTLATNCRPYDPDPDDSEQDLAIADLKCEPLGRGAETVKFHLFTNRFDLRKFMDGQRERREGDGVNCRDSDLPRESPWVDRRGRVRGELLCADYSDDSTLMWSYEDTLVVASAASAPESVSDLHLWWQRQVRFGGQAPPAGLRRQLLALLPESFGVCRPMPLLSPAALSGVLCRPGDGISTAGAQLFSTREMLASHLDRQADVEGVDDEGCRYSPLSYSNYGYEPDYDMGYLFCQPEEGVEWFEWSALDPLVYAFAAREDSDARRLYQQWSDSLSHIGRRSGSKS